MKILSQLKFTLLSVFISTQCYSQYIGWNELNFPHYSDSPTDLALYPDSNFYYVINYSGWFYKSTNGGVTWSKKQTPAYYNKRIYCSQNGYVYLISKNGAALYRSINYGETWHLIYSTQSLINDIFVDNQNDIWLALDSAIVKSSSNPIAWDTLIFNRKKNQKITLNSLGYCFAAPKNGGILLSKNKGVNWVQLFQDTINQNCTDIQFDNSNRIYAVINSNIYFSSDHGSTWIFRFDNVFQNFALPNYNEKIYFISDPSVYKYLMVGIDSNSSFKYASIEGIEKIKTGGSYAIALQRNGRFYRGHLDSIEFRPGNFFPLHLGNKWQYLYHRQVANPYLWEIRRDTIIDGKKYFLLYQGNAFQIVRYDPSEDIIFVHDEGQDSINMNMNLPPRSAFRSKIFFRGYKNATVLPPYMFNDYNSTPRPATRYYYVFSVATSWENHSFVYLNDLGLGGYYLTVSGPGGSYGEYATILARAIINYPDSTSYFSDGRKPLFYFTPKLVTNSLLPDSISFWVDHYYNEYNNFNGSYYNFIDSVIFESYYRLGDSIFLNSSKQAIFSPPWNYKIKYDLIDSLILNGCEFYYRIKAIDLGIVPEFSFTPDSGYYKLTYDPNMNVTELLPFLSGVAQNYPNPFNPTTMIKYTLSNRQHTTLKVFDLLGREVAVLVNEEKMPGVYEVEFDASSLSSGVYYYQLRLGDFLETKKMILMR